MSRYQDRSEAGRVLAEHVAKLDWLGAPLVIALPRGGVPVGAAVARALGASLVAMPVAKVGAPGQEELAVGAVAPGGVAVLNEEVVRALNLGDNDLGPLVAGAGSRVQDQLASYCGGTDALFAAIAGSSAVVVDDGLATGATMRAALLAVRTLRPGHLVMAVPVAPPSALASLSCLVDDVVCPVQPAQMKAVGAWYQDFAQTDEAEVRAALIELGPPAFRQGAP